MSEPIYLDTNVFLDLAMDRKGSGAACKILVRALKCDYTIIASNWLQKELDKHSSPQMTKMWFTSLQKKNKLTVVEATDNDVEEAMKIDPDHFQDPLHAILAKKGGAKILVTRDLQGYAKCRHLLRIVFTEGL